MSLYDHSSPWIPQSGKRFRFRVTYKIGEQGEPEGRTVEFRFATFDRARQNYKSILLELYRNRKLVSWDICLNRCADPRWKSPIFHDSEPAPG